MHVLLHVEVTPDIDLDSMQYKDSIIFGSESAYIYRLGLPMVEIKRILGECLLISSLPGSALRTHVERSTGKALRTLVESPSLVNLISEDANLSVYKKLAVMT